MNSKYDDANFNSHSDVYSWIFPNQSLGYKMKDHFYLLLLRGSVTNTILEHALLVFPFVALHIYGYDSDILNVKGSMSLFQVSYFFCLSSFIRRIYNAYLEAAYFSFPKSRTQTPPMEDKRKYDKDIMGRTGEQLKILDSHDRWTMISQFLLNFALYYCIPGFYPAVANSPSEMQYIPEKFMRLILNHYIMSFGMYWAHRSLHEIPLLWKHIHSIHHWAKHPLSRNTYEDHWFDNFFNAIAGHCYAQILMPLDYGTFWFSRIFRILESLEKHSGVSGGFNIAHSLQQWLPYAQMPHHHDLHHEGYKSCNFTFASIGGLWDCLFGTRKRGRYDANHAAAATRQDAMQVSNPDSIDEKMPD
mmetsp:Transcript_18495/g.27944  ORF Transcript_18495/g.27944 Transcript_18495/m.27944 type:complete len:359 (+) Transcript_18495:257-1333(+)